MALAAGLSRKLKKVLETKTDNPDLLASLGTLSSFYTDNTPRTRRNLKSTIETRSLDLNHLFLDASLPAQEALNRVEEEVNSLFKCCDQIAKVLSSCTESTGDIINTTERLKQELEITTQRQDIVSCFLRDYQLSNEEINALRDEDLNEDFFKALFHVQEIHANCKTLLRTHHQRAGLELMDMMSVYQEGAYERLCRWVHSECKKLGDNDNPEVGELLKTAVRCLKERPVLFKYCAEEVANMRHHALFRRFITALTRGGPGGLPRPIEVHAHDPLRYVGDMLGWLHQALASERELVLVLLNPNAMIDIGPTANQFSDSSRMHLKTEHDTTVVLDRIFEGACRPFKVRVDQVLQSQPTLIVSYKLSNTLEFYNHTISELLGKDTALCNTIELLKDACQQTFFNILKSRGEKLLRYPPLVPADLSPPLALRESVSLLLEIIDTYNGMMVPASGNKPEFDPVIQALLDPIIEMCKRASETHKSKGSSTTSRRKKTIEPGQSNSESSSIDAFLAKTSFNSSQSLETPSNIFLINCLCAIQQPLVGHDPASKYVANLGTMIETHINMVVDKEVESILSRCGLLDRMGYIERSLSEQDTLPLAGIEEMTPQLMLECLRTFFGLVTGTEGGSLPEFELIQVPRLRSDTFVHVAKALAESYELIYNAISDPKNHYPDPKLLLRHSPDQIRTILAI